MRKFEIGDRVVVLESYMGSGGNSEVIGQVGTIVDREMYWRVKLDKEFMSSGIQMPTLFSDKELKLVEPENLYILVHIDSKKVVTSEATLEITKNTQEALTKCGFETTMYKKVV